MTKLIATLAFVGILSSASVADASRKCPLPRFSKSVVKCPLPPRVVVREPVTVEVQPAADCPDGVCQPPGVREWRPFQLFRRR